MLLAWVSTNEWRLLKNRRGSGSASATPTTLNTERSARPRHHARLRQEQRGGKPTRISTSCATVPGTKCATESARRNGLIHQRSSALTAAPGLSTTITRITANGGMSSRYASLATARDTAYNSGLAQLPRLLACQERNVRDQWNAHRRGLGVSVWGRLSCICDIVLWY